MAEGYINLGDSRLAPRDSRLPTPGLVTAGSRLRRTASARLAESRPYLTIT